MRRILRIGFGIGVAGLALGAGPDSAREKGAIAPKSGPARASAEVPPATRDARALAATIDRFLAEGWEKARIVPAGPADDAGPGTFRSRRDRRDTRVTQSWQPAGVGPMRARSSVPSRPEFAPDVK